MLNGSASTWQRFRCNESTLWTCTGRWALHISSRWWLQKMSYINAKFGVIFISSRFSSHGRAPDWSQLRFKHLCGIWRYCVRSTEATASTRLRRVHLLSLFWRPFFYSQVLAYAIKLKLGKCTELTWLKRPPNQKALQTILYSVYGKRHSPRSFSKS